MTCDDNEYKQGHFAIQGHNAENKIEAKGFYKMNKTIIHLNVLFVLFGICIVNGCQKKYPGENIDISKGWRFAPDENNVGVSKGWFATDFNDANWKVLDAGTKWEEQGFPDLDDYGWYRKSVVVPKAWKGKSVWLKFTAVNDAYTLYINGERVSFFGEANISVAARPTFTEISKTLKFGKANQISLQVNDWGGSGGLWRTGFAHH